VTRPPDPPPAGGRARPAAARPRRDRGLHRPDHGRALPPRPAARGRDARRGRVGATPGQRIPPNPGAPGRWLDRRVSSGQGSDARGRTTTASYGTEGHRFESCRARSPISRRHVGIPCRAPQPWIIKPSAVPSSGRWGVADNAGAHPKGFPKREGEGARSRGGGLRSLPARAFFGLARGRFRDAKRRRRRGHPVGGLRTEAERVRDSQRSPRWTMRFQFQERDLSVDCRGAVDRARPLLAA
jgi:hypothetical protein